MSTPDPKTVRDFARRAILSSAEDVDYCGIGEQFGDEEAWPNEEAAYGAMLDAVYAEQQKATVTVEWPDEQQPADVVTAEQQQDGAVGRVCCEPGWQCVECVSDDEFRFEPLGRPTEES